ncbi:glutamine amidotransferase [Pycnococcus provasolii]|mmetsp:Transcript_17059/g.43597  ORF Transcript_17059/g.43597 Transcript_17059/m.43597 type:complete len:1710 (-) Transcript_17059:72-5201(-)
MPLLCLLEICYVYALAYVLSLLIHESAHFASLVCFTRVPINAISINTQPSAVICFVLTGGLSRSAAQRLHPSVRVVHSHFQLLTTPQKVVTHTVGILASFSLALWACSQADSPASCAVAAACVAVTVGSVVTDLIKPVLSVTMSNEFQCGNFGAFVLADTLDSALAAADRLAQSVKMLQAMAATTAVRGGQSGGIVTLVREGDDSRCKAVRYRHVPTKRGDVSIGLANGFRHRLRRSKAANDKGHAAFLGHTRFATSSTPSSFEAHPHVFRIDGRPTPLEETRRIFGWRRLTSDASWTKYAVERTETYITHNGDFDFYPLFGNVVSQGDIGAWLCRVLGVDAQKLPDCDSVKIAGVLELLRTQGVWALSIRLAYVQLCAARDIDDAINLILTPDDLVNIAAEADVVFGEHATRQGAECWTDEAINSLTSHLAQTAFSSKPFLQKLTASNIETAMASAALHNFLYGDLYRALSVFLAHAVGSFGLSATSTLDPNVVVLASRGQPMSLSFAPKNGAILWGSEVTAQMNAPLPKRRSTTGNATYPLHDQHDVEAAVSKFASVVTTGTNEDLENERGRGTHFADASWRGGSTSSDTLDSASLGNTNSEDDRVSFRHDMDECNGEVIELDVGKRSHAAWFTSRGRSTRFQPFPHSSGMPELWMRAMRQHGLAGSADSVPSRSLNTEFMQSADSTNVDEFNDDCIGVDVEDAPGYGTARIRHLGDAAEPSEFVSPASLIELGNNSYISQQPVVESLQRLAVPSACDLVGNDLADVPMVLNKIRESWKDSSSYNVKTARNFYAAIREAVLRKLHATSDSLSDVASERVAVDVLVTGVEVSLWVGEQFASDLQNLFPCLRVIPVSANKVIGVLSNSKGSFAMTGFSFCSVNIDLKRTIVVALSHSGQTFPTMHATHALAGLLPPDRLFVVAGSVDSKMAQAVGQYVYKGCPWKGCVFDTMAGWRPSEPCSLSVLAMHHTLTELMLYIVERTHRDRRDGGLNTTKSTRERAIEASSNRIPPSTKFRMLRNASTGRLASSSGAPDHVAIAEAITLSEENALGLRRCSDMSILFALPKIVGTSEGSATHSHLTALGRHWAEHILESPRSWILSAFYIAVTIVILQLPAAQFGLWAVTRVACSAGAERSSGDAQSFGDALSLRACGNGALEVPNLINADAKPVPRSQSAALAFGLWDLLIYALKSIDAIIYIFLPMWSALALRWYQCRAPFARMGKRTIVIADVPYVHQTLEAFASKLFSLSYSSNGLDVHGASAVDHFVHRFTHRVVRGVLILAGRPDGRLWSQMRAESWILLALRQAKCIVHPFVPSWLRPNMKRWLRPGAGLAGPCNLGFGPEVITVGHNPFIDSVALDGHVALPKHRPDFVTERLASGTFTSCGETAATSDAVAKNTAKELKHMPGPGDQLQTLKHLGQNEAKKITEGISPNPSGQFEVDRSYAIGMHALVSLHAEDMNTLAQNYAMVASLARSESISEHSVRPLFSRTGVKSSSAVGPLRMLGAFEAAAAIGSMARLSSFAERMENSVEGSAANLAKLASVVGIPGSTLQDKSGTLDRNDSGSGSWANGSIRHQRSLRHPSLEHSETFLNFGSGVVMQSADAQTESSQLPILREGVKVDDVPKSSTDAPNLLELFSEAGACETWWENRIASMERLLSHMVLLHAMAWHTSTNAWPVTFETWRSQSQLRVATTAAPVSASDVSSEWR